MENYLEFYKSMFDNQKKMMEGMKNFVPQVPGSFSPADLMKQYEEFMKQQQALFGNYSNYFENFTKYTTDPLEAWQKVMSQFNPLELSKQFGLNESVVFEKMLDANKFYLSMYNFYEDIRDHYVSPAVGQMEKITGEAVENFDKMFRESMLPLLPAELRPLFENPYNLTKTVVEVTSHLYAPWRESLPEMTEALMKAPMSKDQLSKFVELWRDNYNKTIGAMLKSPAAGLHRDLIMQQKRAVDATAEMLLVSIEFLGQISNVTSLQGKLSVEEWVKELNEAAEPKSFKEFYDYWTKKIEDELVKFFYTDEYSKMLGRMVEAGAKFKIESDKLAEKYLAGTVVVTKGQIDSLYETVYKLKREVRALKKELASSKEAKPEEKPAK
ncbi:MAG: poly(R)-hydroxyalkanoic acid synthase subunit PhaE [Tissierellia bacterium]|nr:poly(R)-hydroxyalkanoic acid synthase subunit PhaE [Tissierellia bacterium]